MKTRLFAVSLVAVVLWLPACDSKKTSESPPPSPKDDETRKQDTPLLPVTVGDSWIYDVKLEIPADVTSPGAAEVNTRHRRTRTYLGKLSPAMGLPETDCFEVVVTGSPNEREFVDILDDRILMRGSLIMRQETTRPMWLQTPVPFVIAGMKPGNSLPEIKTTDGSLVRNTRVIARENTTVPAGTFPCIRLLTTGTDGDIELRRSLWFSPGKGIIREEKTRFRQEKLIFRETHELAELKQAH